LKEEYASFTADDLEYTIAKKTEGDVSKGASILVDDVQPAKAAISRE